LSQWLTKGDMTAAENPKARFTRPEAKPRLNGYHCWATVRARIKMKDTDSETTAQYAYVGG
jgi:hypothetical protein